jgi:hypothetical protein
MSLDGRAGTPATAELDGGGRTTLLAGGLQWQLLRQDLVPLTIPSATGITQGSGLNLDKYLITFTRPEPGGQYVSRWIVPDIGNIDESFATTDAIPGTSSFIPSVDDVGAILRTRTKDNFGNELGTFTEDTRPTDQQCLTLIGQAYDDVVGVIDDDIPETSFRDARSAIALRAAMLVELSFWPDQVPLGRSPYAQLKELFDGNRDIAPYGGMLGRLQLAVARETEEELTGEQTDTPLQPVYDFGGSGDIGLDTIW